VELKLTMTESTAQSFYESQLSKDQVIQPLEENIVVVCATVPFTSQLVWWLRSFGKKLLNIEPAVVYNAVKEE
ncbi:MAG: WYL domain-containing protein, partial [Acinetobacter sp.]|nr:WYL domain-containing protein [Acinetobacter sp.]